MRYLVLACLVWPLSAHDWLIVPGERVGPVTARTTAADLRAAFGDAPVSPGDIRIDSKTSAPGVEIYRGRPNESLAIVWPRKEGEMWWPLVVIPCYGAPSTNCRWRTASDVRVGSTIAELEALNGAPFLLYPSVPLQGWTEPRWKGGRLASELGDDVELTFDSANDTFFAGSVYLATNAEPLNRGTRRVNRMAVFLLAGRHILPPNDWQVYGHFWSMLANSPIEPLRETLGATVVHRTVDQADEGLGEVPGITIFAGRPDAEVRRRLIEPPDNFTCGGKPGCRWRLLAGLPWTMSLAELERRNGRPFVFNGFGFDLGGIITSWEGGRMPALLGGPALLDVECTGDLPRRMIGDGQPLRSNDPELRKFRCSVVVVSL